MADSTVSGLTAKTTLAGTDILYLVQSPFGSGDDRKVTFANLVASALATPTLTGAVTLTGGTVNGTVLDISQTWGGTGTYTGLKYNVTDDGPANSASLLMDLQVGNSSKFKVSKSGTITSALAGGGTAVLYGGFSGYGLGFDGSGGPVVLLGNGAGSYRYRLATNFELANVSSIAWCSSWAATVQDTFITRAAAATLQLGAADAASPVAQTLQIQSVSNGTSNVAGVDATINLSVGTGTGAGGRLVIAGGVTGTSGSTPNSRVRGFEFVPGASASAGGSFHVYNTYTDASNYERLSFLWFSNTAIIFANGLGSGSNRKIKLQNGGAGQTVSFDCNAIFETDNTYDIGASSSANRPRNVYVGSAVHAYSNTAIPAGGTTGSGFKVSSATNFGVFFGSGAPTLSAAKGSLYLRSDGSTTNDRMYVNSDGSTTWTAVTTAA